MKRKKASVKSRTANSGVSTVERRAYERIDLPAIALALDGNGNELGRVVETGGGGLLLNPASPWARLFLVKGQQFRVSIVEPATGNKTDLNVEVRYIRSNMIGLLFL